MFFFPLQPVKAADDITKLITDLDESVVEIAAGEFLMGTDRGEINERPAHKLFLDTYFMSRYEISNRQYRVFLESTNHAAPFFWNDWRWNKDNYPVIGISWNDADNFCKWLSEMSGRTWRLPTEAEWEKAASWVETDKSKRIYPWGKHFDRQRVNIVDKDDDYERSAPVDSFREGISSYGIYHLADNVSEWCLEWFENDFYSHSPSRNPKGPKEGVYKAIRGGDWGNNKLRTRNTFRKGDWPQFRYNYYGFRVVRIP